MQLTCDGTTIEEPLNRGNMASSSPSGRSHPYDSRQHDLHPLPICFAFFRPLEKSKANFTFLRFFPMEKLQVPALKYLVILFNPSSKIEDPFLPFPPHWSTQWRPTCQLRLSPYATLAATVRSKREGSWSTTPRHRRKSYAKNIRSPSDTRQIRPYLEYFTAYNTPKKIEKWFTRF